jgi:hypothetical protein
MGRPVHEERARGLSKTSMKAPPMLMVNMNIRYITTRKIGMPSSRLSMTRSMRSERLRETAPTCVTVACVMACAKL